MIRFITGNLLEAEAEALVNTVNCVGIMGRGIALQFKNAYPDNFTYYKHACDRGEVVPGKMLIYHTNTLTNPKYIINFPTKRHWKGKSHPEDILNGLDALVDDIKMLNITSIAIPPLGSGLGGLDWNSIRQVIKQKLQPIEGLDITIYEPIETLARTKSLTVPAMTASRAITIKLIDRYLQGFMDPYISLLEVQKLMYFMQSVGEPLKLDYKKGPYGPYAQNLRHVLNTLEGHYIAGYGDGGDDPRKPLQLISGAVKDADTFLRDQNQQTIHRLNKVSDIVSGFESSFGLELLATVHWLLTTETVADDDDLIDKVHTWNRRKQQFTSHQIIQAYDQLKIKHAI